MAPTIVKTSSNTIAVDFADLGVLNNIISVPTQLYYKTTAESTYTLLYDFVPIAADTAGLSVTPGWNTTAWDLSITGVSNLAVSSALSPNGTKLILAGGSADPYTNNFLTVKEMPSGNSYYTWAPGTLRDPKVGYVHDTGYTFWIGAYDNSTYDIIVKAVTSGPPPAVPSYPAAVNVATDLSYIGVNSTQSYCYAIYSGKMNRHGTGTGAPLYGSYTLPTASAKQNPRYSKTTNSIVLNDLFRNIYTFNLSNNTFTTIVTGTQLQNMVTANAANWSPWPTSPSPDVGNILGVDIVQVNGVNVLILIASPLYQSSGRYAIYIRLGTTPQLLGIYQLSNSLDGNIVSTIANYSNTGFYIGNAYTNTCRITSYDFQPTHIGATRNFTITPDTDYNFKFVGYNGETYITLTSTPTTPTNLRNTGQTASTVSLAWDSDGANTADYNVYSNGSLNQSTVNKYATVSSLGGNLSYTFKVRGVTSGGTESGDSNSVVALMAPNAPSGLAYAAGTTTTAIPLTWIAPTNGCQGYRIYNNTTQALLGTTASTSGSASGLTPNGYYNLVVKAYNTTGESAASNIVSRYTLPDPPSGLTQTDRTTNSVVVSWTAPATGAANGYNVYSNSNYSTGGLTQTISGLSAGASYTCYVRSANPSGESISSPTITVYTALYTPSGLSVSNPQTTELTLSWNTVANATSYDIYVNGSFSKNAGNTNLTTITGLTPNTSYLLAVQAKNTNTASAISSAVSGTTLEIPLATPTGLAVSNPQTTELTLTWNKVTGATYYDLYVNGVPRNVGDNSATTVINLTPGGMYTFTIQARTSTNSSPQSSPVIGYTLLTQPNQPTASNIQPKQITLTWNTISLATGYNVYTAGNPTPLYTTNTTATITGLTPGQSYTFTVVAINPNTTSIASPALIVATTAPTALLKYKVNDVIETINLYSNKSNPESFALKVNGNIVYASVVDVTDPSRSKLRIKTNSIIKALQAN